MIRRLPEVDVEDGGDTWDWECTKCHHKNLESDGLGEYDILICDNCSKEHVHIQGA
jgi:hypothetical protein